MREDLLNNEGIRIAKTRTDCTCAYSGTDIEQGTHGLLFRMRDSREDCSEIYSSWVSMEHRTELEQDLSQFDFENTEPRQDVSPYGAIAYSTVQGETISCLACGDSMEKNEEGISFVNYTNRHRSNTAWCHIDCVPVICGALNNIEDYSTEIVSQLI